MDAGWRRRWPCGRRAFCAAFLAAGSLADDFHKRKIVAAHGAAVVLTDVSALNWPVGSPAPVGGVTALPDGLLLGHDRRGSLGGRRIEWMTSEAARRLPRVCRRGEFSSGEVK